MNLELRYIPSILHNITKTFFFQDSLQETKQPRKRSQVN